MAAERGGPRRTPVIGRNADLLTPRGLRIASGAISWRFSRSGGAGGQHVNTSDTKAEVTCNIQAAGLPPLVQDRIVAALGSSVVVSASSRRSQLANRLEALERLADQLDTASQPPPWRGATRPTRGSIERRLETKKLKSKRKSSRHSWRRDEDR